MKNKQNYNKVITNRDLTLENIQEFIDNFWVDIMDNYGEDQVVNVIFKVEYDNNVFKSFSSMKKVTKNTKYKGVLYDNIEFYILNNLSHYDQLQVRSINFTYALSDHNLNHVSHTPLRTFINNIQIEVPEDPSTLTLKEYDFLPKTMSLGLWNTNITFMSGHRQAYFVNKSYIFEFKIFSNYYNCILKSISDNSILLKFKDIIDIKDMPLNKLLRSSADLKSFTRVIYKKGSNNLWDYEYKKYYYKDGMLEGTVERIISEGMKLNKKFPKVSNDVKS
jgi:hypothetical protein